MSETIEAIEKLRNAKENEVKEVYTVQDLETVYERQTVLNSMAGSIYTDAANVMLPALKRDGFSALVWSNVSGKLDRLNFVSVPTASDIREKYGKAIRESTGKGKGDYVLSPQDKDVRTRPKENETIYIKEKPLPPFLALLAAEGIAIPLVLKTIGHNWHVLVKAVFGAVVGVVIAVEIIKYFDIPEKILKRKVKAPEAHPRAAAKTPEPDIDWDSLYSESIKKVEKDNLTELNRWFNNLKRLTEKELQKAAV